MTGRRLAAAFSIMRLIAEICGDWPTSPCAHSPVARRLTLGSRVNSYDKACGFLNRILSYAFSQAESVLFGGFRTHQHPPDCRVLGTLQQARTAIARLHLRTQTLRIAAV